MHQEHPELVKDQYWEQVFPNEIPYNITSKRTGPPASSTSYMKVPQKNLLRKSSTSGSYLDFLEMNDRPFQDQDRSFTSRPSQSIDFYELVEQRRRERRERTRHRFLDMKVHLRHDNSGTFYTITVPRPASEEVSSENQEAAEPQQDPSSENDSLSKAEKKD